MMRASLLVIFPACLLSTACALISDCVLTAKRCANFPKFSGTQFPDKYGSEWLDLSNPSACLRRAEDFHHWCGNGRENANATVSATYVPTGDSQIYHPSACPADWSLYKDSCYVHVWRAKTWWEAEAWCNAHNAHLCSIHGKAENEFVFTLTKGLSSWIGYHETQDQSEDFKWSDNSKTDFENMNKNCTGREMEPDCAPKEQAQKWHDWNGADRGTWVCKKPAKWALGLLRNTTISLGALPMMDWEKLKVPLSEAIAPVPPSLAQSVLESTPLTPKKKKGVDLGKGPKARAPETCDDCE